VEAAQAHPLLRSCAGLACYRELPVSLRLSDGSVAEGNIDLAWFDGQTWTIVDFKTDSAEQKRYQRQLRVYGLAVQRATRRPVRCLLFEV
jgi:ATP-dependent exoDNAse (exonuclease V) beta subunit